MVDFPKRGKVSSMKQPLKVIPPIRLKDFNPDFHNGLNKDETREKTRKLCERLADLQNLLYANAKQAVLILLQGMDTSGKDGAVKSLLEFVTPFEIEIANFKAPTSDELAHDFLWRIHKAVPRRGHIGVFNRSHYEDVLVVRVMKLQPEKVWRARYEQINDFEKYLAANDVILLKFFLHISKREQAERLQARLDDRRKNWKFEAADLAMREQWDDFQEAYQDVLNRCSPRHSPWYIIPADRKWYRDYVVAQTVVDRLEKLKLTWPRPKQDLSKIKIA